MEVPRSVVEDFSADEEDRNRDLAQDKERTEEASISSFRSYLSMVLRFAVCHSFVE